MSKNPHAVALGRLGGLKGGRAWWDSLSDAERLEATSKAGKASAMRLGRTGRVARAKKAAAASAAKRRAKLAQ